MLVHPCKHAIMAPVDCHQPDGIPNHLGPTVMTGLGDVVQGANVELLWSTGVAWPCLVWVYWVYLGAVVMSRTSWEVWMFSFSRHSTELWLQVARDFMAGMTCDSCHTALRRELLLLWRELGASWGEVAQEACLGEMSKDGNWNGPGQIQEFQRKALDDKFGWVVRNAIERLLFGRFWRVGKIRGWLDFYSILWSHNALETNWKPNLLAKAICHLHCPSCEAA